MGRRRVPARANSRTLCRRLSGAGSERLMDARGEMGGESDTAMEAHGRYYALHSEEPIVAISVNTWALEVNPSWPEIRRLLS